jgi:hypothetical protein
MAAASVMTADLGAELDAASDGSTESGVALLLTNQSRER